MSKIDHSYPLSMVAQSSISTPILGIRIIQRNHPEIRTTNGRRENVNQIAAAIFKAVLVTLVSTAATIAVEKIRRYNEDKDNGYHNHPGWDEYDRDERW